MFLISSSCHLFIYAGKEVQFSEEEMPLFSYYGSRMLSPTNSAFSQETVHWSLSLAGTHTEQQTKPWLFLLTFCSFQPALASQILDPAVDS